MKILFLARSLEIGGAERQLLVLATELASRGHEVSLALLYAGGPFAERLADSKISVHHLKKRGRWDVLGPLLALRRLVLTIRPQVLHGYLPVANILGAIAGLFVPKCRVVFGIRASDMDLSRYDAANRLLYTTEAWLARTAGLVISNSAAGLRSFWERGAPKGRGLVIPNGIDTDRFKPDPVLRRQWRHRLGVDDRTCLVGLIARRDPMKDHETALSAAARMGPGYAWVMAGNGVTDNDPAFRAAEGVRFLGPQSAVEGLMAALDIGVLSSRFGEGFPNVLAEMMACGVACVTTDVGDAAEIVAGTGVVVPRGDAEALAQACAELAARLSPGLSGRCREVVRSRYSVEQLAHRTEAALANLEKELSVHVITGLETGGAELMLTRLVRGSSGFRHVVVSLTGEGSLGASLRADGIEVIALGLRPGVTALLGLPRLVGVLRRLRPSVVQTWLYHADILGTIAAKLAGCGPVIWNLRCSDMDGTRYGRLVALLARLSPWAGAIVANSRAGQQWHQAQGYRPGRWDVVANGIDSQCFRPDAEARARWRRDLDVADDAILVGMAARVDPMKDHQTFMAVAERMPGLIFVAAGRGTEDLPDGPVLRLGEVANMAGFYASLDIAVQVSRFGEGFPNAVAEAMSCGLPVVATQSGDSAQIVGDCGICVPAGDVGALEAALSDLAGSLPHRRALGEAARRRIVERYGLASAIAAFEAIWRRVMATKG
jgi:glycosyltransferase involved in cell wall biosynthesis